MVDIDRIQAQLRHSAAQSHEAVLVPPFTCFFNPDDDAPHANYAIPDVPVSSDLTQPLAALRQTFAARRRRPRFEFVQAFAPDLAPALQEHGFVEEARTHLMLCTPATFQAPPAVAGLTVTLLSDDASLTEVQDFVTVQRRSFGPSTTPAASEADAVQYRRRYGSALAFLARMEGQAAGAGSLTAPYEGISEVAGIGTIEPFRRQGVAGAVTAEAVRTAFARGINLVFLTAGDERAGRVYERVGFRTYGLALVYIEPELTAAVTAGQ